MKISTEIGALARLVGEEESIRMFAAAGFEAWDFSMFNMAKYNYSEKQIIKGDHPLQIGDYRAYAKRLRKEGKIAEFSAISHTRLFPHTVPKCWIISFARLNAPQSQAEKSA